MPPEIQPYVVSSRSGTMTRIHLLTGPIQTGKTTRLLRWCTGRTDVDGILAPVVDDHRHLVRISNGDTRDLEELGRGDTPVKVGPYTFSSQVFAWGREQLTEAGQWLTGAARSRWLVVDEYGKLELRGEGLEPDVTDAIRMLLTRSAETNVLLVIRGGLVEPALQRLGLSAVDVVEFDFR